MFYSLVEFEAVSVGLSCVLLDSRVKYSTHLVISSSMSGMSNSQDSWKSRLSRLSYQMLII